MEFIRPGTKINFVGVRNYAFMLSAALILMAIILFVAKGGSNYGIDFTGGILIETKFNKATDAQSIRDSLEGLNLGETSIQDYGQSGENQFLIRIPQKETEVEGLSQTIQSTLEEKFGKGSLEIRRVEMVGPKVGADLREKALFAMFYAILFIGIYISGRFEMKWGMSIAVAAALMLASYGASLIGVGVTGLIIVALLVTFAVCYLLRLRYALGAIVALAHDVLITAGIISLCNIEISLNIVAALLTIIGYSLNDTIVVYDRIRENLRKDRRTTFEELINTSLNETLSRTLLTGATTLMVLVILYFFGGPVNADFAFTLIVGIIVGTYSSVYVASPILLLWPPPGGMAVTKPSKAPVKNGSGRKNGKKAEAAV